MAYWILGIISGLCSWVIVRRSLALRSLFHLRTRRDGMTRLFNRLALEETLTKAMSGDKSIGADGASFALLVIGLDNFRRVNELYGYAGGDKFLLRIAERLKLQGGETTLAFRLAGDEFALAAMNNKDAESAKRLATSVLTTVEDCTESGFSKAGVTASVGISLFPGTVRDAEEALVTAHRAMWSVKHEGGSAAAFSGPPEAKKFTDSVAVNKPIRDLIRGALDQGGLRLVFQPILDRNDRIVQMEALVRIHDRKLGIVAADQFVHVAEETGLIHEMGHWILSEACRQVSVWRATGHDIAVAINVSAAQLNEPDFIGLVVEALRGFRLPGSALVLEVTRSKSAGLSTVGLSTLLAAKRAGIGISADLAGEVPGADLVKVACSNLAARPEATRVVATYVEEFWQLEKARSQKGCELFQGYLIAPPLEPEDATQFLVARKADSGPKAAAEPALPMRT